MLVVTIVKRGLEKDPDLGLLHAVYLPHPPHLIPNPDSHQNVPLALSPPSPPSLRLHHPIQKTSHTWHAYHAHQYLLGTPHGPPQSVQSATVLRCLGPQSR